MEEVVREDEEDAEVMAVVAVEVSGGEFLQKVRQRARPLSSTRPTATGGGRAGGRRGGGGGRGWRTNGDAGVGGARTAGEGGRPRR